MDHSREARVGLVATQGDALELLQLAEEVLDQVPPLVHLAVEVEQLGAARMLRDHDLGPAPVQLGEKGVAVEGRVADQRPDATPSISGGTPTVSNRWPGSSTKRTRLPSASVSATILVV